MRLFTWLLSTAESLYWLAGFLVVAGGFVMFIGSTIHHYVTRPPSPTFVDNRRYNVHVENLNVTIEMTKEEALELISRRSALPPGGSNR